jgi:hypothetical protein
MKRLVPAALAFVAIVLATSPGAAAAPALHHVIYVTDQGIVTPPDAQVAKALKMAVARFLGELQQIAFARKDAELSYIDLKLDKWTSADMALKAKIVAAKSSTDVGSDCTICPPDAVNHLLRTMIEDTLFTGKHALYVPLPVEQCHVDDEIVTITVATANGIGLERSLWYGVCDGVCDNAHEWALTLKPRTRESDTAATFAMRGSNVHQNTLRNRCDGRNVTTLALRPHLVALRGNSMNSSQTSVTH